MNPLDKTQQRQQVESSQPTIRLYIWTSETYEVRTLFFVFISYILSLCVCVKSFCKKNKKEFKTALITLFMLLLSNLFTFSETIFTSQSWIVSDAQQKDM